MLTVAANEELKMSSLDFLNNIINPARIESGQNAVRPSDFHERVNDEIDEELNYENFVVGKTGHKTHYTMLNMEQMTLIGMRESKAVRRSVLSSLKEMQAKQYQLPDFTDPAEAARAWASEFEQKKLAQQQLAIAAPKVEFYDRYADASGTFGFRQVCKALGEKEHLVRTVLVEKSVMYRLGGQLTPYQNHIDAGRFTVKTGEADNGHAFTQARFTTKGVTYVAGLIAEYKLSAA